MELRTYTALIFGLLWVVGYVILAPICYIFPLWRHQLIASSLPCLVFGVLYYFIIPESFHFLVSNGRTKDLKKWYENANRFSKNPQNTELIQVLVAEHSKQSNKSDKNTGDQGLLCSLFKQKTLLLYTAVLAYLWYVIT